MKEVNKIFTLTFHYTMFFFSLFTGILYFLTDFFLSFVYGDSYLTYSVILKLVLLYSIFTFLNPQISSLIQGAKKVKIMPILGLIFLGIRLPVFLVGLIYFGLIGAIIGLLISSIIGLIIRIYIGFKVFNISLNIKRIVLQYGLFFFSIGIVIIFEILFLNNWNYFIFENLNLLFIFEHFQLLSSIFFVLIYLFLNILFRVYSKEEIDRFISIFEGEKKINKFVIKILNIFKRFLKSDETKI
jgi:O-antigen/teichoic acid export membrane protein